MSEEDIAVNLLKAYCKNRECKNCKFYWNNENLDKQSICGIHNPSAWKGEKE